MQLPETITHGASASVFLAATFSAAGAGGIEWSWQEQPAKLDLHFFAAHS